MMQLLMDIILILIYLCIYVVIKLVLLVLEGEMKSTISVLNVKLVLRSIHMIRPNALMIIQNVNIIGKLMKL